LTEGERTSRGERQAEEEEEAGSPLSGEPHSGWIPGPWDHA